MLLYIHRCAGVSEWQTMWTQNPLVVIPCGFDPHHRHKNPQPQGWGFFAGGGGRTERRWKHRKQSPSGALFSSRVSPYGNQYRGRSRGRFKGFPSRKAGGFFAGGGGRTERRWKHRKQSPSGALFSSRVSPYRKQYRGRSCGRFKIFPSRKAGGFLPVVGVEQSGGGNTANKAPVGLCLARGCHRIGSSTGAEAVDGLRVSPAARLGVFCWWRGSNRAAVETPQTKPQWGFV